jgi:general stress protein YciG
MPNNNPHGHNQYTRRDQTSKPSQPGQGGEHQRGEHQGGEHQGGEHQVGEHQGGEHAGTRPSEPSHSSNKSRFAGSSAATPGETAVSSSTAAPAAMAVPSGISRRGFASMDQATQREIASKGGHAQGRANNPGNFANDREKAREAGRKGGEAHGAHRQ